MHLSERLVRRLSCTFVCALLTACASTTISIAPSPQAPVCDRTATALVLWTPQWRPNQKDVAEREKAAASGLDSFLAASGCFARSELRRVPDLDPTTVKTQAASDTRPHTRVVTIGVRELGPVVKLLSSVALVEGGTEVVLEISEYAVSAGTPLRQFTVHWANGGAGIVKGVASLPSDMQAALTASLQPGFAQR
jgi:hypothetical protein